MQHVGMRVDKASFTFDSKSTNFQNVMVTVGDNVTYYYVLNVRV